MKAGPRGASLAAWLVPAGLVYFALVGGTAPGEVVPILRLVNSALGIGLIVLWMRAMPTRSDALDRSVLAALLLFLVSAVLAKAPHAAFEAAITTTAYAALFFLMRTALSNPATRSRTALWLGLTGVVVAAAYVAIWLMVWAEWLGAGQPGWTLFHLPLTGGPYGFKHNLALIAGLLIPFLWIAPSGIPGRIQRVIGGAVLIVVVYMAGSRALWVGAAFATLATLAMHFASSRRLPRLADRRWWLATGAALLAVAAIALFAPGLARPITDRLGDLLTISARRDLWAASLVEWHSSALTGVGPGGWPIWLPTTGYFDVSSFSLRHPDSLLFQLLAEIGIVGVAAVLLVAAGVWRSLRAAPPAPAIWVAVFLAVACLTANPSDLPFAVVLGAAWLAIAVPRVASDPAPTPHRALARARYALLGVIVVALGASSAAGILHDRARQLAESGDTGSARHALEVAITLDPGLALYRREQGVLLLASDNLPGALASLRQAAALDPADDITQAELAVALSLGGNNADGMAAAQRAIDLRRSALMNHLVLAWVADRAKQPVVSASALADSLVIAPWLAAADGWPALLHGGDQQAVLVEAARRAGTDPVARGAGTAAWLAGMTGRGDMIESAPVRQVERDRPSLGAVVAVLECDIPRAQQIVADAAATERGGPPYWVVNAMVERAAGHSSADAVNLATMLDPASIPTSDIPAFASAFDARADDQWIYDRVPMRLAGVGPEFPSEELGWSRWLSDPRHAARFAAPDSGLAQCND